MSFATVKPTVVVLDTNIIVSAVVFGGLPREILGLVIAKKISAVISSVLSAELWDVLSREKFSVDTLDLEMLKETIKDDFVLVQPKTTVIILKDDPDNRVLEAAIEGNCDFIVTGDKDLLGLKEYKGIKIVSAADFASWTKPKEAEPVQPS